MLIRKDVFKLAGPIIAEQTFMVIMGVINTIMAGHLGKEAVSAIGMVDSINNIFISFFSALAVGGTVVIAHYTGQENSVKANEAGKHALFSSIGIALSVTVLIFILRHSILALLFGSAEQSVIENSMIYLNITLLTYPLIAVVSVANGILRGVGDTKTPMKVTIIMNVLNVIFSYICIYGLSIRGTSLIYGMGVKGAAIGIALARTVGSVLVMYSLISGSKTIKITLERNFRFDKSMLKSIFGVGLPASVESLMFNGGKLITQIFIVGMGTASIAANSIAGSIVGLINIPGSALGIAATTMIGQYMGHGDSKEAENTLNYLFRIASVGLLIMCTISYPLSRLLSSLYTSSPDVIAISTQLLKVTFITTPILWAASFLIPAGLKGAGDAKYTMVVSVLSMWFFRITFGYILGVPLKLGVLGVWMGMFTDWALRGGLFYYRMKKGKWKLKEVV